MCLFVVPGVGLQSLFVGFSRTLTITYSFSFCGPINRDHLVEMVYDEHAHSSIVRGLSAEIEHNSQPVDLYIEAS